MLNVRLLVFEGCPLAAAARRSLGEALRVFGPCNYREINILDDDARDLRGWGSPTILVNGIDITGQPKGDGVGCRVYDGPDRVPSATFILDGLRRAATRT